MLNPIIRLIRFNAPNGEPLAGWKPGAHIKVQVTLPDGNKDWRHYSLIGMDDVTGPASDAPMQYTIAVRREVESRGGSAFMHDCLQTGDLIPFEQPSNNFVFDAGGGRSIFVAGGIGITPMLSMVRACVAQGKPLHFYYAGRSRDLMAFLDPLTQCVSQGRLTVHADDEQAGAFLDIQALMDSMDASDQLYLCGPKPMLDSALASAKERGWPADKLRFELFTMAEPEAGDQPFEIELAQSGETLTVPADQSVLDCLIEHGYDPLYDCKRGECGVCTTDVLQGEIEHRDYVLTESEKASGKMMQICVSRAKGNKLVLDI